MRLSVAVSVRLCECICESGLEGLGFHKSFIKVLILDILAQGALIQNSKFSF